MTDTTLTIAMSGSSTNSSDTSSSSSNMNMNMNMSCTMPDFIFYDINGDIVNGTVVQLDNNSNDGLSSSLSSSICIFDKANCDPTDLPHECCSYNKKSINTSSHSSSGSWSKRYMILCALFPFYYLKNSSQSKTKMTGKTKKTKQKGGKIKDKTHNGDDGDEEISNDMEDDDDEIVDTTTSQYPWFIRNLGRDDKNNNSRQSVVVKNVNTTTTGTVGCLVRYVVRMIWNFGFKSFMFLSIVASIVLQYSYQAKMSVANRNLLMSAEAFMTPYQTIFTFIEDIVLVQIGYALGRKDKVKTNHLIHSGIAGSIVTGIIAGSIGTLLGLWPNVFSALTNPGLEHDHEIYDGCPSFDVLNKVTSISTIQAQRNIILPYWLLKSWSMIWQQIGMVVSGFFFGSKAIMEIGWIMTISLCLNLFIWFTFVGTTSSTMVNPLTLVGISDYVSDFTTPVLALLYLGTPLGYEICNRTGVTLSWTKLVSIFHFTSSSSTSISTSTSTKDTNDIINETTTLIKDSENGKVTVKDNGNFDDGMSTWNLLLDGLKVMFMDVAIQGCVSFTLYVALVQDSAVAYQISALQSALPSYGYAYAFVISMMFKLVGSQLLAEMKYEKFVKFATICTICVLLLIPGIMISVVQDRHEIALRYGSNACSYLKEKECSKFFIGIFGVHGDGVGDFTLQHTFAALAFGSIIDSISLVLRSILLSLLDFNFLVKATICAVVFAYVPAMYIATFYNAPFQGQAIAYYIAMNIPQLFLVVVFLVRLYNYFQRILNGGEGPWMEMVECDDDDDNDVATAAYEKDDVVSLTLDDHDSRRSSSSLKKRRSRNSSSSTSSVRRSSYKSQFRPLLLSHYRRSSSTSSG